MTTSSFIPRFVGDSPTLVTLEERVIALGERQRRHRAALLRLGHYCRDREVAGDDPAKVEALYRRALRRINRATDAAGVGGGFAPGLPLAAE